MSLRTTGLIAGVIGVILLIVGFIANSVRPPEAVVAYAEVDTPVVVYDPDFVTISPDGQIAVEGSGEIVAYTARPVDAEAWLDEASYSLVTGLPDWETLSTRSVERVVASPSPSPSPSASASPSASPSPSPSASASPSASPSASAAPAGEFIAADGRSSDLWRDVWTGTDRVDIPVASIPTGLTLVVMSADNSALTGTELSLTRTINDDWIAPLLWWGAALLLAGLIALVVLFIDLRPAQSRSESWIAARKAGAGPKPGSRRSRRAEGATIPQASLDETPEGTESPDIEADEATAPESVPDDAKASGGHEGSQDNDRGEERS